jgi:hypothetical protein
MCADFDKAIDGAVHELLASEVGHDIRARVVAAVGVRPRRLSLWTLAPIGAAAAVILAFVTPRPHHETTPFPVVGVTSLSSRLPGVPTEVPYPPAHPTAAGRAASVTRALSLTRPGAMEDHAEEITDRVPALAEPASIAVEQLPSSAAPPLGPLHVTPLDVQAIEIAPLNDSLPNRQHEEQT